MRNKNELTLPHYVQVVPAEVAEELRKKQEAAREAMGDKSLVARPYNDELRRMGRHP